MSSRTCARLEMLRRPRTKWLISAPFDGRLGQFLVKPGAIVKSSETELVELSQIDPIDAAFNVPEQRFPAIREAYLASAADPKDRSLRVEVVPSGDTGAPGLDGGRTDAGMAASSGGCSARPGRSGTLALWLLVLALLARRHST